jgi:competence protein ComEA
MFLGVASREHRRLIENTHKVIGGLAVTRTHFNFFLAHCSEQSRAKARRRRRIGDRRSLHVVKQPSPVQQALAFSLFRVQRLSMPPNRSITQIGLLACALCIPAAAAAPPFTAQAPPARHASPPPDQRLDINFASFDELLKVPGMTRVWAGRIVRNRPYRTKQDLIDRGIVSSKVYSRIKDFVIAHREKP